jgi:hypothetical protein
MKIIFLKKESRNMAKAKKAPLHWTVLDGVMPNRVGDARNFNLKNPLLLNIPPGATVSVDLGLSCNYPLFIFDSLSMRQRRLRLSYDSLGNPVDGGTFLKLTIKNEGTELAQLERGDVLGRAFALDNNDVEEA